ncbi:MAG TPA: TIGR00730 family Rossman fold protein [Terriglobales bacterium]|nr:TIGR00730 family Rossman fold protein [Terriglobales bacterium]
MIQRVCVFCGSNGGARPEYVAAATALGKRLAERNIGLVYGGAGVGLMGAVADAVLAAGGEVTGVMPRSLVEREVAHSKLRDLRVVGSMHERKALMAELADAFIALPGGLGTLEEFFEVWTWAQLGEHSKPLGMLNVAGYYDPLLVFFDHLVNERFIHPEHRAMVLVEQDSAILLSRLTVYNPPLVSKWIDRAAT